MSIGKRSIKKNRNSKDYSQSRKDLSKNNSKNEGIEQNNNVKNLNSNCNSNNTKDSIERNKYVLDLVNMWINNADNKISLAFAILSAIFAIIVFLTENWLSKIEHRNTNNGLMICFYIIAGLSALFFLISVIFYLLCIIPRFTSDNKKINNYSIFYGEIKDFKSSNDYVKCCKKATDENYNEEIMREIYYNSRICYKKMRRFKFAVILSAVSIVLAVPAALLYYLAII